MSMQDLFHLPDIGNNNIEYFYASGNQGPSYYPWRKPKGATFVQMILIGAGGGGGQGVARGSGSGGGGGGGGSGFAAYLLMPAFLLPDTLYVTVGSGTGGGGNPTGISLGIGATSGSITNLYQAGAGGAGGTGTASVGGPGGLAGTNTVALLHGLAAYAYGFGAIGAVGGFSSAGLDTTYLAVGAGGLGGGTVSGGAGGGAVTTVASFAGGKLTPAYSGATLPTIPAGLTAGGNGRTGIALSGMFAFTGGSGAGGLFNGTGGLGGRGAIGCGGGGGGGGLTGGLGGIGGDGLAVIITS